MIQVIWLNWGLTDEDLEAMPASVHYGFSKALIDTSHPKKYAGLGADMGDGMGRVLCAGSWNAEIYTELQPHVDPSDVHCAKNRMSGLWSHEQPLWKHLSAAGKQTLFFTGVNTDQCVLGTLANGYNDGWDVIMVDDCCATTTKGAKEVCVWNISRNYGFVCDSKTFVEGTT
jgi:nicotinamidase-related amidase